MYWGVTSIIIPIFVKKCSQKTNFFKKFFVQFDVAPSFCSRDFSDICLYCTQLPGFSVKMQRVRCACLRNIAPELLINGKRGQPWGSCPLRRRYFVTYGV
jgi:hypothetical protein